MKAYYYSGSSILSFTWKGKDYVAFGEGPHVLPSDSQVVITLASQKILKEVKTRSNKN